MPSVWYRAQDTLAYELEDGTQGLVNKGDVLQASHELVKRDIAARKKDGGLPLFVALAEDEPKSRAARKAELCR